MMTWTPKKPFFTLKNLFNVRSSQITLGQHHPPPLCPPHLLDLDQMSQDGSKLIKFSLLWHTMEVLVIMKYNIRYISSPHWPFLCKCKNQWIGQPKNTIRKVRPFGIEIGHCEFKLLPHMFWRGKKKVEVTWNSWICVHVLS